MTPYGVTKQLKTNHFRIDLFQNELFWLKELAEFDRVPNVLWYDEEIKSFKMPNLGDMITKDNIPQDWEVQMEYIIEELDKYNCSHNDVKPEEILVKEGKLYLIDFGWATKKNEKIAKQYPRCLGGKFRKGKHNFDDGYSFRKSIKYVLSR